MQLCVSSIVFVIYQHSQGQTFFSQEDHLCGASSSIYSIVSCILLKRIAQSIVFLQNLDEDTYKNKPKPQHNRNTVVEGPSAVIDLALFHSMEMEI